MLYHDIFMITENTVHKQLMSWDSCGGDMTSF